MDNFEGRKLFDPSGYKIGDIETVFSEDGLGFALVKSGLFGTIRRLVPLNDVRESGDELSRAVLQGPGQARSTAEADRRLSKAARERL